MEGGNDLPSLHQERDLILDGSDGDRLGFRERVRWVSRASAASVSTNAGGLIPHPKSRPHRHTPEAVATELDPSERIFLFCVAGNAIVGAAEPPTELAVDILHHHHIRVDVGLVVCVEVSGGKLVQHGWAVRDDGG
jgi:hypothetical protein